MNGMQDLFANLADNWRSVTGESRSYTPVEIFTGMMSGAGGGSPVEYYSGTVSDNYVPSSMFEGNTYLSSVSFQQGISGVNQYAFKDCVNLRSLRLPISFSSGGFSNNTFIIGAGAFEGCANLSLELDFTSFHCGSIRINSYAFSGCRNMDKVELLSWPLMWSDFRNVYSFYAITGLFADDDTVPSRMTSEYFMSLLDAAGPSMTKNFVYSCAFAFNSQVTHVEIPSGFMSIFSSAGQTFLMPFFGCRNLTSDNMSICYQATQSINTIRNIFPYAGTGITEYDADDDPLVSALSSLSTSVSLWGVGTMSSSGFFQDCRSLSTANLRQLSDTIHPHAFEGCRNLTEVRALNITSVSQYAFAGCGSLRDVYLKETSRTYIYGRGIFSGCSSLRIHCSTSINITRGSSEASVFMGYLDSEITPEIFVNGFSADTFNLSGSTSTTANTLNASGMFASCPNLQRCTLPITITQSNGARELFAHCGIRSVTYENFPFLSANSIWGTYMFYGCSDIETIDLEFSSNVAYTHPFHGYFNDLRYVRFAWTKATSSTITLSNLMSITRDTYVDTLRLEGYNNVQIIIKSLTVGSAFIEGGGSLLSFSTIGNIRDLYVSRCTSFLATSIGALMSGNVGRLFIPSSIYSGMMSYWQSINSFYYDYFSGRVYSW